jgi:hypothetical protein
MASGRSAQVKLSLPGSMAPHEKTFPALGFTWELAQDWCRSKEPHCFIEALEWQRPTSSVGSHRIFRNSDELVRGIPWLSDFGEDRNEPQTLCVKLLKQPPRPEPSQIRLAFIATLISYETSVEKTQILAKGIFDEVVWASHPPELADGRIVLCHRVDTDGESVYIAFRETSTADDVRANVTAEQTGLSSLAFRPGFLKRSHCCDITLITELISRNVKVVLCGHSIGGAVAGVRTLQLSLALGSCHERLLDGSLRCIGFGAPFFASAG